MSCDLTRGRLVDCKNQVGGLRAVYFVDTYANNIRGAATIADDVMTAGGFTTWSSYGTTTAATQTVFKYDLRPDLSSLTVNTNSDPATGTTSYEQVLELTLQQLSSADSKELRLIAYNRAQIFVEDNNGNLFLLGMDNGMNVTAGVAQTGAAHTDMSGYTLTLTGREKEAKIWLPASAGNGTAKYPFDGLSDEADLTITVGT